MKESPLGLLIPEGGDPPKGPEQIGGNAERADALLQKGGVGGHSVVVEEVTRTSTAFGSFSTPLAVTLPVVKAGQIIDIYCAYYLYRLGGTTAVTRLEVGANALLGTEYSPSSSEGKFDLVAFSPTGNASAMMTPAFSNVTEAEVKTAFNGYGVFYAPLPNLWKPIRAPKDATNVKVELVGKASAASVRVMGAVLAAHVRA